MELCGRNGQCVNSVGSYECVCVTGSTLKGGICQCECTKSFIRNIHEKFCCLSLAITCDKIFLENGSITFSPDMESPYVFGTEAAHACDEGFSLVGAAIRICMSENGTTGVWGGVPSSCERELNSLMHLRAANLCDIILLLCKHAGIFSS